MRHVLLLAAAALLVAVPGCLEPFRAHVDPATLAAAGLPWQQTQVPLTSGGAFGPNRAENDYQHSGNPNNAASPPFPGLLQVFSQRELSRRTNTELLGVLHAVVDNATAARAIRIDRAESQMGARTLANGLATNYFVEEGTSTAPGLFAQDTKVRILGEVGYDAASHTAILVVGIAQVQASTQCPILGPCSSSSDLRTWIEMVGDPAGSVTGATSRTGLVHNLVTHG